MSLLETPEIKVNGSLIEPAVLDAEVQYHPAASRREAMVSAAETLILSKLIVQKAIEFNVPGVDENSCPDVQQEYQLLEQLMTLDEQVPAATDDECLRYYEANKARFFSAPLVAASHILLAADPQDITCRNQQQEAANKLLAELQAVPERFEICAKQFSQCPSKTMGGDLGQIVHGQTVPEFQRVIFTAKHEGIVPFVVESRYGFHIIRINHITQGKQLPFELVKDKILSYLNQRVARKSQSQYLHRLVAEAEIQGFDFQIEQSSIMQ